MKITTRGRFAVNAMMHLAIYAQESPVSLPHISSHQNISVAYLEQIFCKLRRAGLVTSVRGPGGGYFLGRPRNEITVGSIIDAVDEDMDARQCRGDGTCKDDGCCLTHALWSELNEITSKFLESVTLQDILNDLNKREKPIIGPKHLD